MPVQDLTPQLRTRLSRVERAVGWFVILATLLLLAGFGYYVYHTAERKGWFLTKLRYHTFVESAAGLHVGDPITLMGFNVGQITWIDPMPPFSTPLNVYVEFIVREPYYGYIWTDSYVKVVSAGLLGNRSLEVVQGGTSTNSALHASYNVDKAGSVLGVWNAKTNNYVAYTPKSKGYGFDRAREAPPITDRLEALADQAQQALPGILDLTNQLSRVLSNAAQLTGHADGLIVQAHPIVTNLAIISGLLTNGQGSLGEWVIPTNLNAQLQQTLASANSTLITANTNVATLASNLNLTLENVANITSNLNAQVQANDRILSQISSTVVSADIFVQGLKHHWLLRSAFKNEKTNPPPAKPREAPSPVVPSAPKTGKRLPP
jgi:MlaD protein